MARLQVKQSDGTYKYLDYIKGKSAYELDVDNGFVGTEQEWLSNLHSNTYTLPEASSTTLGGIKVGTGLSINNGVLSATGGSVADSIDWSNVQNKPTIPTKTSQLTNDSGYLKSIPAEYVTDTELTAKGYLTAHQDISGKENISNKVTTLSSTSTDTQYPSAKNVYNNVLTPLNTHKSDTTVHITASERTTWNGKSNLTLGTTSTTAFRGDYGNTAYTHSQSAHAPSNAEANVQVDWNETTTTSDAYIKNKPVIPSAYSLPTASSSVLGGIKVGSGLTITNGVLSASGGGSSSPYTFWSGTQFQFDAITTKDANTIYLVKNSIDAIGG